MASGQVITDYLSYGAGAPAGAPSLGAAGQYALYQDTATGDVYEWDLATTAWVRIWNHAVPSGPTGATGPTGGTGPTGATGPSGETEIDYAQVTAPVTVAGTTEAGATLIVAGGAHTYDGSTSIMVEIFCPFWRMEAGYTSQTFHSVLYDGASSIGYMSNAINPTSNQYAWPMLARRRLTPSAGSHTYSFYAYCATTNQSTAWSGAGGAGLYSPSYIRITKV